MFALLTVISLALVVQDAPEGPAEHAWGVPIGIEDADGRSLDALHASLRATRRGERKTRILQFGASHTAADLLTGYVRRALQERFGSGGHGWFMPARPWKTYRHQDLVFEDGRSSRLRWDWDRISPGGPFEHEHGQLGLAGMAVIGTHKRQRVSFATARRGPNTQAGRLELWYASHPRGGDLLVTIDGARRPTKIRTRATEPGFDVFEAPLKHRGHRVTLAPRGNGEVRLYGAVLENERPGVVVDTLGINGSRARSMLLWDEALWTRLVRRRDPALIVLAYGTNESGDEDEPIEEYEATLAHVLARVRRAAPSASCVLFGPTDRPVVHKDHPKDPLPTFTRRMRTELIVEAQRRLAKDAGCGFFDAFGATGGRFSIVSWAHAEPRLAYGDFVHLTSRGYQRLAELFTEALLAGLEAPGARAEAGGP